VRARILLPALALLVAFSPVLAELAEHLRDESWARYALVFVPLFALVLRAEPSIPARRDGLVLLGLALAFELFCLAGNTTRLARPAFALAIVGLCRSFGLARARTSLLAFWLVPVPWVLLKLTSPGLERFWIEAAAALVNALGGAVEVQRSVVHGVAGSFAVRASDSGGIPVVMLAGLGWYAGLRCRATLRGCVQRALTWGALGLPAQAVGSAIAVSTLAVGHAGLGRAILDPGIWLVLAIAGIARAEQLARRGAAERQSASADTERRA
jgi:hypothetical protein